MELFGSKYTMNKKYINKKYKNKKKYILYKNLKKNDLKSIFYP